MPKKDPHLLKLQKRIERGIKDEGTNPHALSKAARVDYETTRDILAGIRDPKWTTACRLLTALNLTA